jgi:ELWxxDGT repeat protein
MFAKTCRILCAMTIAVLTMAAATIGGAPALPVGPVPQAALMVGAPYLVADLIPGPAGSSPRELVDVAGTLYFTTYDEENGLRLWKSDGTAGGTVPILSDDAGQALLGPRELTVITGSLYFSASHGGIPGVWRAGAGGVVEIPYECTECLYKPFASHLTAVGESLYFISQAIDYRLWRVSPGEGAEQISYLGHDEGSPNPENLTAVGSRLFFNMGSKLWVSDADGTRVTATVGSAWPYLADLTALNDTLYFTIGVENASRQVWQSNGTPAGTSQTPLENIHRTYRDPRELTVSGGKLYLVAYGLPHEELWWVSPGGVLAEAPPYWTGPFNHTPPSQLTDVQGILYFVTTTCSGCPEGIDLWKLDGGTASRITQITSDTNSPAPHELASVYGVLFFAASEGELPGAHGEEPWTSDGTQAGTGLLADLATGTTSSAPAGFTGSGNLVFFSADDGIHGRELWAAPMLHVPLIQAVADVSMDEGERLLLPGTFSDLVPAAWTGQVDYGDGSGFQPLQLNGTSYLLDHSYPDDGVFTVKVEITDGSGLTGRQRLQVTVANLPPLSGFIQKPTNWLEAGREFITGCDFIDQGSLDQHTAVWDWGDGTTSEGLISKNMLTYRALGSHTYSAPGLYVITLAVTDDDGGSGTAAIKIGVWNLVYLVFIGR